MQNREPPAYQEYAATILARTDFRTMSFAERGLFFTMRLECWVNRKVPASPDVLAKVLGQPLDELSSALPAVMPFFKKSGVDIVCPELDDYRQYLATIREKQSNGGKTGAAITNAKLASASSDGNAPATLPTSNPRLTRRGTDGSLVKSKPEKQSQNQSLKIGVVGDSWVKEYEATEATEYARASGK